MKKALIVGNFSFPLGNAGGKRVFSNGKVLKKLGYNVTFVGVDKNIESGVKLINTTKEFEGFKYYNFPYPKSKADWLNFNSYFKELIEVIETDVRGLDLVIYYGSPSLSLFNSKLIKYCKKKNITVVSDCVDWLTAKTNSPIFNYIKWLDNTYQKAILNKRVDGLIVISKYLSEYYKKSGLETIIIPPLSPDKQESIITNNNYYKTIVYAGVPFRKGQIINDLDSLKDRIDLTIELLHEAKQNGAKFIFNIYGFTQEEYLVAIPSHESLINLLGNSLLFHGMMSNEEVVKKIAEADYTILIRDVNRDTSAGFPTKVSESISYGTPVITTKTSDLEDYLKDRYTSFFIDMSSESLKRDLVEILSMSKDEIIEMKNNCIKSKVFLWTGYVTILSKFLQKI